jgi:myo-inositol-1(or 4)-monophosphatase
VAAGILLVKEAGGLVEGLREGTDPLDGALIAANDNLFKGLAETIRG